MRKRRALSFDEESLVSKPCGIPFTADLLKPKYWFSWLALGGSFIISWLPMCMRHALGKKVGSLIYRYNQKRMHVITTNLRIAFPDLNEQQLQQRALTSIQWYGKALVEYCFLFFSPSKRLQNKIYLKGHSGIDQAIADDKNIVILLTHSVWLDFAPAGLGNVYSLYGSYKSAKNPVLDWIMAKSRCKHVDFVISREEGMMRLVRSLKPGRLLIFLPDEDLGIEHADFAPFFGREKATLNTPARIAKLKKAACFPCFTYFDTRKKQYCVKLGDEVKLFSKGKQMKSGEILNQSVESLIKIEPDQYMWLLKYYRTRPEGEPSVY